MNHNAGASQSQGSQQTVVHYYVDRGGPQPTTFRGVKFKGVEIGPPCLACPAMFGIFFLFSATITLATGGPKALGIIFLILGIVLTVAAGSLIVLFCMQRKRSGVQVPGNYGSVANTSPEPNTHPGQPGVYPGQPAGYPGQPAGYPAQPADYPSQPVGHPVQPAAYAVQPAGFGDQPPPYSVHAPANLGQHADPQALNPGQPSGYQAKPDQLSAHPPKPGQMAVTYEYTPPSGQGPPASAAPSVGCPSGPSAPPVAPGLDPYKP